MKFPANPYVHCCSSCTACGCGGATAGRHQQATQDFRSAVSPAGQAYFHGRLTREQAEEQLLARGAADGLFLLRASTGGNYAVSICHAGRVLHYSVERQPDGAYRIANGRAFPGPVELLRHHAARLDGFVTLASLPCDRPADSSPLALQGVTLDDLAAATVAKATELGYDSLNLDEPQRALACRLALSQLHLRQPWFHGRLCREEAERRLAAAGHVEGAFLVRSACGGGAFALSLSCRREPKHYRIDRLPNGQRLRIEGGHAFASLAQLVDHYHLRQDGLLCRLRRPVPRPDHPDVAPSAACATVSSGAGTGRTRFSWTETAESEPASRQLSSDSSDITDPTSSSGSSSGTCCRCRRLLDINSTLTDSPNRFVPAAAAASVAVDLLVRIDDDTADEGGSCDRPEKTDRGGSGGCTSDCADIADWWYGSGSDSEEPPDLPPADGLGAAPELPADRLRLGERLGGGNFGEVRAALHRDPCTGREVRVAVKTLRSGAGAAAEADVLAEARVMSGLRHPRVLRLLGLSRANGSGCLMLVLELAPLGPVNKFLRKHPECPVEQLTELAHQVSQGMRYLESRRLVHRDLAARNVLLAGRCSVKISDFGLSRALAGGSDYYRADAAGRWPLKWYSPECIYYFRFSCQSDVWSFGVTCWELFSYGARPYHDLKGTEIVQMLERGDRLPCPAACPGPVYELLLHCWRYCPDQRPSFACLAARLAAMPRSAGLD
ncbi:hypothetical protein BOX15_Mlig002125g1 [Macrostomum lignano]|uniref:Tyrosine-protein kinase n=2 Tax=Macrostomum lignano TaxID=282301 RepID=A0A267E4Q8_9PLAT|nr:hypothetical protein BOX15_Mlig002125g1 [Macrostomum lignano]